MDDIFAAFSTAAAPRVATKRPRPADAPTTEGAALPPPPHDASSVPSTRRGARPREVGAAVMDELDRTRAEVGTALTRSSKLAGDGEVFSDEQGEDDGAPPRPQRSVASEIGEALRPRLARGEVDGTRTTAPDAPGISFDPSRPPARVYPFTLDPFQARSIQCLERNESVLVSAHTSAGKTVVAEYAIAMALRDKQRVIYTSPIKALSNQKYRDFFEEFSDVGLMTGDVTINPGASVLVMTTEILRSMLYRGSEVMREVKWVVFDEVHYMRDKERGVVWEESIILLPHKVRFVFLSATIPNAAEFAAWVAKTHDQTCHVVYTDFRPTPLQHFIFPAGGEGVFLVVDDKGRFRDDNFAKAMAALGSTALDDAIEDVARGGGKKGSARAMGRGKGGPSDLSRIVKMIMERHYDPVIVFSFSKRECEQYALAMGKLDFTSTEEKALIEQVFLNAIDSLSDDDKQLPQIDAILPLLKRGVGIHHGGLLPILKEVIEILFQESLLKILFATETFSMGVNMPARTVVFTASRKFDGSDFRWISPGEYIQMSGRAGRRGLDDRGIVIQMVDEKMEPAAAKDILLGSTDPLNSAFHLGYNMLLNLLRLEGGDPERLMALSFHQFQLERAAPAMEAELTRVEEERDALSAALGSSEAAAAVGEYYALCAAMEAVGDAMRGIQTQPQHAMPFLQPGRLVRVQDGPRDWGWGVVAGFSKRTPARGTLGMSADVVTASIPTVVDIFLHSLGEGSLSSAGDALSLSLCNMPVLLSCIAAFSSVRLLMPRDFRAQEAHTTLSERLIEVRRRFPLGVPLLDPIEDMRIEDAAFSELVAQSLTLQSRITASPLHAAPDRDARFAAHKAMLEANDQAVLLRSRIKACHTLAQRDTLRRMKRVLRRLGHLSAENVVQVKGRVAAEVNSADELLVTELIFNGVFNDLDAAATAALLSCLVYMEKSSAADEAATAAPREELAAPLRALQDAARRIATVSSDCRIELDAEEYAKSFNPGMMELVYAWVRGARFVDVAAMTKEFEGTIIRVIRRLEELTRQLADAAKAIGDEALEGKFKEASAKMRRDIVFAASLYL